MMRWIGRIALLLVWLAVLAAGGAWWAYSRVQQPYRGATGAESFIDIPPGTGPVGIGARLVEAGVVQDALTFRVAVLLSGRARALKAGEYRFDAPMTALAVVDKLARGDVYKRLLTFREGLTITEMAAVFEERGFGTAADFTKAAQNASLIHDLDPAARDLEG